MYANYHIRLSPIKNNLLRFSVIWDLTYLTACAPFMCRDLRVISIFIMGKIQIPKDNKKVVYISGYGPCITLYVLLFFGMTSSERVKRED